jgi:hypothetical protein
MNYFVKIYPRSKILGKWSDEQEFKLCKKIKEEVERHIDDYGCIEIVEAEAEQSEGS